MRQSIVIEAFGGPEALVLRDEESPALAEGAVRVAVKAAGVNRADILLRTGAYHGAQVPARPGLEAAGEVTEAPAGSGYAAGDRVLIYADRSGLYTTEAVPSVGTICRIPDGVTYEQAAALPINWLTAWYCLKRLIRLEAGERVLVLAAASGVGTAAVQIASALGAEVIACAGSPEKLERARALGASHGIDYRQEDLVERVRALTGGALCDGVLDAVGGRGFAWALKALGPFGRVAALANVTLEDSLVNTRDFYPKNASIFGFQFGRLLASGRYDPREDMEAILAGVCEGAFAPVIDRVHALRDAREAHRRLESRESVGKEVLVP